MKKKKKTDYPQTVRSLCIKPVDEKEKKSNPVLEELLGIDLKYRTESPTGNVLYNSKLICNTGEETTIQEIIKDLIVRKRRKIEEKEKGSNGNLEIGTQIFEFPDAAFSAPSFSTSISQFNHELDDKIFGAYGAGVSGTAMGVLCYTHKYCKKAGIDFFDPKRQFNLTKQLIKEMVKQDIEDFITFEKEDEKIKITVKEKFKENLHHSLPEVLMGINFAMELIKAGFELGDVKTIARPIEDLIKDAANKTYSSIFISDKTPATAVDAEKYEPLAKKFTEFLDRIPK
jgi:hypothetical protein